MHASSAAFVGGVWGGVGALVSANLLGEPVLAIGLVPILGIVGMLVSLALHAMTRAWFRGRVPPRDSAIAAGCSAHSVFVGTLVAFAIPMLCVPPIQEARETARRSQCENILWQHSGHHGDVVFLNDKLEIDSVGSCPTCTDPNAVPAFFLKSEWDTGTCRHFQGFLPLSTYLEAKSRLDTVRRAPKFQRIYKSPSRIAVTKPVVTSIRESDVERTLKPTEQGWFWNNVMKLDDLQR